MIPFEFFGDENASGCSVIWCLTPSNTVIVSPIYYVMFKTLAILATVIMFKDWDGQSFSTIMSEICSFIVVLSGTIMLHLTKDFERKPFF